MKTQMQLANRAWRKATKHWRMSKKKHRAFCRENAAVTVEVNLNDGIIFENQRDADWHVEDELTCWGD